MYSTGYRKLGKFPLPGVGGDPLGPLWAFEAAGAFFHLAPNISSEKWEPEHKFHIPVGMMG